MRDIKSRHFAGRNPRGYGLPSLVVVLFFVTVITQVTINMMAREASEAKAEAAFNIAREHLVALQITGMEPDIPHLEFRDSANQITSPYITPDYRGDVNDRESVAFTWDDSDIRAKNLFEQKLRSYISLPESLTLGQINRQDIPRSYSDRIMRNGDHVITTVSFGDNIEITESDELHVKTIKGSSANMIVTAENMQSENSLTIGAEMDVDNMNTPPSSNLNLAITANGAYMETVEYDNCTGCTWE